MVSVAATGVRRPIATGQGSGEGRLEPQLGHHGGMIRCPEATRFGAIRTISIVFVEKRYHGANFALFRLNQQFASQSKMLCYPICIR